MRLRDKVAIVTGGASGMGEAVASLFAKEGATVAIGDIDFEKATAVVSHIHHSGHNARVFRVDVTNEQEVQSFVAAVLEAFGRIDILVNCVGASPYRALEETSLEQWRRDIDINLTGVFICCKEVAKTMISQRRGKIVNIASIAGLSGVPYMVPYTAAKHGVVGFTRALAAEWGKYNINVNCICPGATLTPLLLSQGPKFQADRMRRVPLGRLGKPMDQANAVLFLACSDSDYITGSAISVDGGVFAMAPGTSESQLH